MSKMYVVHKTTYGLYAHTFIERAKNGKQFYSELQNLCVISLKLYLIHWEFSPNL